MSYIKVKDKEYLIRDTFSNGIVNVDSEGYDAYVENYRRAYNETKKIKDLESDVNEIKNDLNEIKNLLRNLSNESK